MTEDTLICHFVAYEDSTELDVEYDEEGNAVIQNHDEMINKGKTYDEVRALHDTPDNRQWITDDMILQPGDSMWRDEYADMEPGDSRKIIV